MAKSSDIIKIGFDYRASLEQFEKETNGVFDGISEKAGKQKISIQLDAKNDKVIEKIKELQKLKLDKFTFEFGESGLAEQLKTFDQLEKKITEIINLSKGLGTTSSPIVDVKNSTAQIDKLQNKLDELSKKYDELSNKKLDSTISREDINLADNEEFKRLSDEFSLLKDELTGLKREMQLFEEATVSADTFVSMEHSVNGLIVKVDDLIDKYVQLSVAQKNASPVETNISSPIKDTFQGDVKASSESSTPAIKDEAKAMEQVAESAEKASKGKDEFAKANKKVKESADSSSKAVSEEASEFNKIISKLDGYNTKLAKFEVKPADGNRFPVYQENITNLSQKIERLQELSTKDINLIDTNDVKEAKALQKEIDELIFKMSNMSAGEKGFDPLSLDKAVQKMNGELEKASGMSKKAKLEIKALISELESGNPTRATKEILHDFYKIIRAEQEAGRYGKAFMDIFKDKVIYGAAANLAGMIGIYDIINVGRQAVDIVIDLNTQITELAKVSEDSMSQIYDDFNSYAEIAKDIGGTISDTISATSDWSRNGYSIPDSKELAKVALLYKNVGDGIDIDTASESLISTLRGFKMEAEEAIDIIDIFNEVDTLASYYSNVIALCGNAY